MVDETRSITHDEMNRLTVKIKVRRGLSQELKKKIDE